MPDPEETEREALARVNVRYVDVGHPSGERQPVDMEPREALIFALMGPRVVKTHNGTWKLARHEAEAFADAILAAGFRRLSEPEIRRDQAEKIRAAKAEGWERGRSDTIANHRPPLSGFDKRDNPYSATPSPETEQENKR